MVKRNLFEVSQSEKSRILGLHESATKKLYLRESVDPHEEMKKMSDADLGNFINFIKTKIGSSYSTGFDAWYTSNIDNKFPSFEKELEKIRNITRFKINAPQAPIDYEDFASLGKYLKNTSEGQQVLQKYADYLNSVGYDFGGTPMPDPETQRREEEDRIKREYLLKQNELQNQSKGTETPKKKKKRFLGIFNRK